MSKLIFERVDYESAPPLEQFKDRTIFQTREWLNFVAFTQKAEPVVAIINNGRRVVGRFSGLIVKKYQMSILGSPFPGWTTSYMGFNLEPSVSHVDALLALERFAFHDLNCVHLEIMNRHLDTSELNAAKYLYNIGTGFEIDLTSDQETLFSNMTSACRRCIRKSIKQGVTIEIANDATFAEDYYGQLEDVFAKQKLIPTYSIERVRSLLAYLLPTGWLLLLRARDEDGKCIATGIFPAFNDTMYFWGGASWRAHQELRPNEAIHWFAMQYWKERGIAKYDMVGAGEYKRKYGGKEIAVPWARKSKYSFFEPLRYLGKKIFTIRQSVSGIRKR